MLEQMKKMPKLLIGLDTLHQVYNEITGIDRPYILCLADEELELADYFQTFVLKLRKKASHLHIHFMGDARRELESFDELQLMEGLEPYELIIGIGNNDLLNYSKMISLMINRMENQFGNKCVKDDQDEVWSILIPLYPTTGFEMHSSVYTYKDQIRYQQADKSMSSSTIIYDPLLFTQQATHKVMLSSILTLSQALDSYFFTPGNQSLLARAITLIVKNLVRAAYNDKDLEAYEALTRASVLLGLSFADHKTYSLSNCFVIPLVRQLDLPTSILKAAMLPYLLPMYCEVDYKRASLLIEKLSLSTNRISDIPYYLTTRFSHVISTLGFPNRLRTLGVLKDQLASFAEASYSLLMKNSDLNSSWSLTDCYTVYERAYAGMINRSSN